MTTPDQKTCNRLRRRRAERAEIRAAFKELVAASIALHGPRESILQEIVKDVLADAAENNGIRPYSTDRTEAEQRLRDAIGHAFCTLDDFIGGGFDEPNPGQPGEDEWVERMRAADYSDLLTGKRIAEKAITDALS